MKKKDINLDNEFFKKLEFALDNSLIELSKKLNEFCNPLRNKKDIDFMCSSCTKCLFYECLNLGMDGTHYICKAIEPKDSFFNAHILEWVSARDCENEDINSIYHRKCSYFVSYDKVLQDNLSIVKLSNK